MLPWGQLVEMDSERRTGAFPNAPKPHGNSDRIRQAVCGWEEMGDSQQSNWSTQHAWQKARTSLFTEGHGPSDCQGLGPASWASKKSLQWMTLSGLFPVTKEMVPSRSSDRINKGALGTGVVGSAVHKIGAQSQVLGIMREAIEAQGK